MNDVTTAAHSETTERLQRLRGLVQNAKAVPMSASCILNRGEVVGLIGEIIAGLPTELEESKVLRDGRSAAAANNREQADRVLEEARAEARELVSTSQVARQADEYAAETRSRADREAEELKRETDRFVDSRLAEFEAALQKTTGQLRTMRSRLAERSQLDDSDVEALPALE